MVILNGDDCLAPGRLTTQADALDQLGDEVGVVYSDLREVDEHGVPTGVVHPDPGAGRPEGDLLARVITGPLLSGPMLMFRRELLDKIGPWDETLMVDDFDFAVRAALSGTRFAYVPGIATEYRRHGESMTAVRQGRMHVDRIATIKKVLGRDVQMDRLALRRISDIAIALHSMGYDRRVTLRHLAFAARRLPSKRVARVLLEAAVGLRPTTLSPVRWRSSREPGSPALTIEGGHRGVE